MSTLLLPLIVLATLVVILSGIWVTIALVHAIWHVDRRIEDVPSSNPGHDACDPGKNAD